MTTRGLKKMNRKTKSMENPLEKMLIQEMSQTEEDFSLEIFRVISFKPGYHYKIHSHKRIELNYILHGNCTMMLENELVKLNKNNSILILPGSKHDFYVNLKTGIKMVQLEFQMEERIVKALKEKLNSELPILPPPDSRDKTYYKIPNNPELRGCMERIILGKKIKRINHEAL